MADGTLLHFPEAHESDTDWKLFWQQGSDLSDRMQAEKHEDPTIIDTLVGQLTQELASRDELDAAAFLSASDHENPFVRAAVASRVNLLCLTEFEQGASLASLLSLDPAPMVRSCALRSIEFYLQQSRSAVQDIERNERMLKILRDGNTRLDQDIEDSAANHPSSGEEPGGAA